MKVTIQEKKENPLLKRKEVSGTLVFEGATPSNTQLTDVLAKELKVDAGLVVMKNINTTFGRQEAKFFALVYDNQEAKDKIEMTTKHMKKKVEETKKKAAEAAKEEAKPAEVKEEAPAEEKTKEKPAESEEKSEEVKEKPVEEVKEEEKKESDS